MTHLTLILAVAKSEGFDPDTVTPGAIGFAITSLVAVATILLAIDMVRRIRRVTYRADIGRRLDLETAEHTQGAPTVAVSREPS